MRASYDDQETEHFRRGSPKKEQELAEEDLHLRSKIPVGALGKFGKKLVIKYTFKRVTRAIITRLAGF